MLPNTIRWNWNCLCQIFTLKSQFCGKHFPIWRTNSKPKALTPSKHVAGVFYILYVNMLFMFTTGDSPGEAQMAHVHVQAESKLLHGHHRIGTWQKCSYCQKTGRPIVSLYLYTPTILRKHWAPTHPPIQILKRKKKN